MTNKTIGKLTKLQGKVFITKKNDMLQGKVFITKKKLIFRLLQGSLYQKIIKYK
jgi:hypothetical protein